MLKAPVDLNLKALAAHQSDYLRVTMTLPGTADKTFAGQDSGIGFTFTATQRAGINK
jgi:spore coat-associated protein N